MLAPASDDTWEECLDGHVFEISYQIGLPLINQGTADSPGEQYVVVELVTVAH